MRVPWWRSTLLLWSLVSCATHAPPPLLTGWAPTEARALGPRPGRPALPPGSRQVVVNKARALLEGGPVTARGVRFDADPVGFVRAAFWEARIDLFNVAVAAGSSADGLEVLYRSVAGREHLHRAQPLPGDLVFFDANSRGGQLYPVQVAVVEHVDTDGTVAVLGFFRDGPARISLNLRAPRALVGLGGRTVNHGLVGSEGGTAAQLFRTFANPFADEG